MLEQATFTRHMHTDLTDPPTHTNTVGTLSVTAGQFRWTILMHILDAITEFRVRQVKMTVRPEDEYVQRVPYRLEKWYYEHHGCVGWASIGS